LLDIQQVFGFVMKSFGARLIFGAKFFLCCYEPKMSGSEILQDQKDFVLAAPLLVQ